MVNFITKIFAYIVPASSFQYVQNIIGGFVDYGEQFAPYASEEQLQKLRVKAQLRASIIAKEGYRRKAYFDSLNKLTVGIGHLVKPKDNIVFGQEISDERIEALFTADSNEALDTAMIQAKELTSNPSDDFILALTHVNYQLGIYWRTKFPNTWRYLTIGNYNKAIDNLLQSDWAKQTPVRVSAFINAIRQEFA